MNESNQQAGKIYLVTALVMLICGLIFGVLASLSYIIPGLWNHMLGFSSMRPLHVSSTLFWIFLGSTGCVYMGLQELSQVRISGKLAAIQWVLWIIAIIGIFYSYSVGKFGGREYWEFNPLFALPIAAAWLLFIINFGKAVKAIKNWPVYIWMWMTGLVFFLFTFTENYLWLFPYFREHFILDTTIQWKANGSLVGSWNQIIYGTAFYLMERIGKNQEIGRSRIAYGMYFLGLLNLMFNWGHHIYTLPTDTYVRYTGYVVSMTEWVFFARIIYLWKQSVTDIQKNYHYFPYRFLMMADIWVLINLGQAILMSIPALNLYTHGTHVTVAHAMGTTIGINTMILLAACFEFLGNKCITFHPGNRWLSFPFWITQISLLVFWLVLNIIGIKKGLWQMSQNQKPFNTMMESMSGWFSVFVYSGIVLMLSLGILAFILIRAHVRCREKQKTEKQIQVLI
ncbi:MAG: cbb3-type cytochrome c oxidase subunit I [Bacteroidota bacterium]|nr:cbb3-type cytochrome c oxidase subunit I [Bacteroidota bacterium]